MSRLWIICYDIADDSVRREVDKLLRRRGERIQWSVFECFLSIEQLIEARARLRTLIDPSTDSLRYYPLCAWCQERVKWHGQGRRSDDPAAWII